MSIKAKCSRCGVSFSVEAVLASVCPDCLAKNPRLTTKEKIASNTWDHLDDFLDVYVAMKKRKWSWGLNAECKYIDLRVDMRSGKCLMSAKGERISPRRLAWQYSKETPTPPDD